MIEKWKDEDELEEGILMDADELEGSPITLLKIRHIVEAIALIVASYDIISLLTGAIKW